MHIRPLTPEDASAVARLWHAGCTESGAAHPLFIPRMSVEACSADVAADLREGSMLGWGIFDDALLAYLTARVVGPSAEWHQDAHLSILDVDVATPARHRGYAKALLGCALDHAREQRFDRVELGWLADDARSSAVWKALGARPYLVRGIIEVPAARHPAERRRDAESDRS